MRAAVRRPQGGSAVVEFALVMPVLLVVTLGLLQVGLLVRDQLIVTQAARAGAREAAVDESSTEVRSAVVRSAAGLDPQRLLVVVSSPTVQGGDRVVSVEYAMPIAVPFIDWLFPSSVTLASTATMRQEFVP